MDFRRRHLLFVWRAATAWLVVVALLVGPMGLGVSAASAKTCGASCPCDEAHGDEAHGDEAHGDEAHGDDAHAEAARRDAHHGDDGEPAHCEDGPVDEDCPDGCPDDCPDCSCCSGVVLAIVPMSMPRLQVSFVSLTLPEPLWSAPPGAAFHVYRPPRPRV